MAAAGGQLAALKLLREMLGTAMLAPDHVGHHPLHAAAERGHGKVTRRLLQWRAELREASGVAGEAVHLAARHGHWPVLRLLLERGVDVEAKDPNGCTPLMLAVLSGCTRALKGLLAAGAELAARNRERNQALHLAAQLDDVAMTRLLLEKRADLNSRGAHGQLPWMMAQNAGLKKILRPKEEL